MPVRSIRTKGSHQDLHIIQLKSGSRLKWILFGEQNVPRIPFGTRLEITISYKEEDFLNGENGNVWATYDRHQAETIQNALLVQNIFNEMQELALDDWLLHLLSVPRVEDVEKAIDFIWREATGMRLQPDWWYPAGAQNESFEKWIKGN